MLELAADLLDRVRHGVPFVTATVTNVHGSAPRQPGSSLVVDANGAVLGNVSGGCVDAAVHDACQEMLAGSHEPQVLRFGYTDADALGVGLTCGGTIELLLRHHDPGAGPATGPELEPALTDATHDRPVALATIVRGPDTHLGRTLVVRPGQPLLGTLGADRLDRAAGAHAATLLHAGQTGLVQIGAAESTCPEPVTLLVESNTPAPRMLVFGATDHATALAGIGTFLGYRMTVCDARPTFATAGRFPGTEVVVDWPHRYLQAQAEAGLLDGRTVICVLTHDPKFDLPLLTAALRMPVAYVGAMGSRRTHEERLTRLRDAGLTSSELDRLHSPIGLDLGAHTPQETALSIAAEITAHQHGGSGAPLHTGVPIHHYGVAEAVTSAATSTPEPLLTTQES